MALLSGFNPIQSMSYPWNTYPPVRSNTTWSTSADSDDEVLWRGGGAFCFSSLAQEISLQHAAILANQTYQISLLQGAVQRTQQEVPGAGGTSSASGSPPGSPPPGSPPCGESPRESDVFLQNSSTCQSQGQYYRAHVKHWR